MEARRCLTTGFAVTELACCDAGEIAEIAVADINGDGSDDIITSSSDGGGLAWYSKSGDTLGERMPIAEGTGAEQLVAVDVDDDGDVDLVAGTSGDQVGSIVWYENLDDGGSFRPAQQITATPRGAFTIKMADLNGDEMVDLVWGSPGADSIAWHANDGTGNFSSPRFVWANFDRAIDIEIADMDGDGDMDVIGASFSFLNPKVSWFKNDGVGVFTDEVPVASQAGSPWSIDSGDIDGDGDLDVVVSSYRGASGVAFKVINDGAGGFGEPQDIDNVATLANVDLVDMDGDGFKDVVASTSVGQQSAKWYRNQGDGNLDPSRVLPSQTVGMTTVEFVDYNGDGRMDIISNAAEPGRILQCQSRVMGDSTGDGVFDSSDIVAAFVAGTYETGLASNFDQGDWNGDGIFDTSDLVTAFQAGTYV